MPLMFGDLAGKEAAAKLAREALLARKWIVRAKIHLREFGVQDDYYLRCHECHKAPWACPCERKHLVGAYTFMRPVPWLPAPGAVRTRVMDSAIRELIAEGVLDDRGRKLTATTSTLTSAKAPHILR